MEDNKVLDDISSAIVEAKNTYTQRLCSILTPYLYEGIKIIWNSSKGMEKARRTFQEKLCHIHLWNQNIINNEYSRITDNIDKKLLDRLIEAVFLSNVKVLSSVRLNSDNKDINISIPDTKNFIHKCYIECARKFYVNPKLLDDRETYNFSYEDIQENVKKSYEIIENCIPKTVNDFIPFEEILENYITEENTEHYKENNEEDYVENNEPENNTENDSNNDYTLVNKEDENPLMMNLETNDQEDQDQDQIQEDLDLDLEPDNKNILDAVEGENIEDSSSIKEVSSVNEEPVNENDDKYPFFEEE